MEEEEVEDREGEGERTTSPTAAAFLSRTEVVATSNIMRSGSPYPKFSLYFLDDFVTPPFVSSFVKYKKA